MILLPAPGGNRPAKVLDTKMKGPTGLKEVQAASHPHTRRVVRSERGKPKELKIMPFGAVHRGEGKIDLHDVDLSTKVSKREERYGRRRGRDATRGGSKGGRKTKKGRKEKKKGGGRRLRAC